MAHLAVLAGPEAGQSYGLGDEVYLGRSPRGVPDSFLPLTDSQVSRCHARIRRLGRGYVVEDLDSTNGTFLRGERIKPHIPYLLRDGDELRLGSMRMVFRAGEPDEMGTPRFGSQIMAAPQRLEDLPNVRLQEERSREFSLILDPSDALQLTTGETVAMRRLRAVSAVAEAVGEIRDLGRLAARVLEQIFEIFPSAEGAFVGLVDERGAVRPVAAREKGRAGPPAELALSLTVVDEVLLRGRAVLSEDAIGDARFEGGESVMRLGLRSLMCAPLAVQGRIVGLIQVDSRQEARAFDGDDLRVLLGVAAHVATALHNARLYGEIEELFESFIRASVQAIEARDPVTAGHSFRVAAYAERLAQAVERSGRIRFAPGAIRQLRYAALLHDFGKVGVREHVLTKPSRLYPHQLELVRLRFRYARAAFERDAYRRLAGMWERADLDAEERRRMRAQLERMLAEEAERLERMLAAVEKANRPCEEVEEAAPELVEAARYRFPGVDGTEEALLTPFEFRDLQIVRGSLTPDERLEIESHVSHTYAFLSLIPWRGDLADVPEIAYGHHEKLDGSGYPRGLSGDRIPAPTRILTIADIYDALTSGDRPYKAGMPPEQALAVLDEQARSGALDAELVRTFIEAEVYRR